MPEISIQRNYVHETVLEITDEQLAILQGDDHDAKDALLSELCDPTTPDDPEGFCWIGTDVVDPDGDSLADW